MLEYVLIGISLVLLGVAGLQFSYMFYVERMDRERKKHVKYLERENRRIAAELEAAQDLLAEQRAIIDSHFPAGVAPDEEHWAEILDER